jgi:hypothetical protein
MPDPDLVDPVVVEAIDGKTTEPRPVEPVKIAMVGTGDGSRLPTGTIATTEGEHEPNLIVKVVTPALAIAVRALNTFFTVMSGAVSGIGVTNVIPFSDFTDLLRKAAVVAVFAVLIGVIKDCATIFGRLEGKFPLLTGNV